MPPDTLFLLSNRAARLALGRPFYLNPLRLKRLLFS
jgi:hypothetical protein